jgi:glycine/D-amino acid oxidase-like deaminating enzyme
MRSADIAICGAGIAGIAAAYHLAVRRGVRNVVLIDERPPLSLTSDKSTECYRNWWPGPGDAMVAMMNRSIDLLEELARESDNAIRLNRRGYLFATANPGRGAQFVDAAKEAAVLGAGPARIHADAGSSYVPAPADGFEHQPRGADVFTDPAAIRRHFPYLAENTVAVLHARRAGWFSGQQLGMYLLERAREKGVELIEGRLDRVDTTGGRVRSVTVSARQGTVTIATPRFVNAAGPFLVSVGQLLGIALPVFCERHAKIAFDDVLRAIPRSAPLLIWSDPVRLPWSDEERTELARWPAHRHLLEECFPEGAHGRPEGGTDSAAVLMLWNYHVEPGEPALPLVFDPEYPEIVLRGMSRMIPGLVPYFSRLPRCVVDGGYYAKTRENRCLVGPLPVEGAYVLGALSGYGLMAASGAADLLVDYIAERPLPPYAPAFRLDRYADPAYQVLLNSWEDSGQL